MMTTSKAHNEIHQHKNPNSIFEYLPGPVKVKDGLFLGDQIAAKDIQFINSNKVTHIINTVSKKVPNLWERFGIHYLSVNWTQKQENIFDKKNNSVNMIYQFIQEAMEVGESCLIHSMYGKSRATAVMVAYLMKKYAWSLSKCLEFITSKKENLVIRKNYHSQLQQLQVRMSDIYNLSNQWKFAKNQEELLQVNTFANSLAQNFGVNSQSHSNLPKKKNKKNVKFAQKPSVMKAQTRTSTIDQVRSNNKIAPGKSILKGQKNQQSQSNAYQKVQQRTIQTKGSSKYEQLSNLPMNNFMQTDKKNDDRYQANTKTYANSRPYSSDQKDRDRKQKPTNPAQKKLFGYDSKPMSYASRSAYDPKSSYTGSNSFGMVQKKKQVKPQPKYERPQSAKQRPGFNSRQKQQLIVTNGGHGSGIGKQSFVTKAQLLRKR